MIMINTHEAKTKLSQLITEVENRKEIVRICRNGKPVADLVPVSNLIDPFQQHPELIGVNILYDPTAPLTSDEWPEEDL